MSQEERELMIKDINNDNRKKTIFDLDEFNGNSDIFIDKEENNIVSNV